MDAGTATEPTPSSTSHPSPTFRAWRLALLASLSAVIIVSNALCIAVLRRASDLKKATRILMVSMSIADLGTGALTVPFKLLALLVRGTDSPSTLTVCALHIALHTLLSGTSLLCVLLVTLERYVAVEFPLRHRSLVTARRCYLAVGCAWALGGANAAAAGSLAAATTDVYHDESGACLSLSAQLDSHYEWFQLGADVVVPLVLIVTIYARILVLVGRHCSARRDVILLGSAGVAAGGATGTGTGTGATEPQPVSLGRLIGSQRAMATRRKSLCTFLLVVLTYVLTFVPSAVIMILAIAGMEVSGYAIEAAWFSVYCYSWLNVVVFALRNRVFRETARALFCSRRSS